MNKKNLIIILLLGLSLPTFSQGKYMCRNGHASFFSTATAENIEAHNHQTSGILDLSSGKLAISIPITGFKFEKALMQEHFNENYLESAKYPKATFKGSIQDFENIDMDNLKGQPLTVVGTITIHGVTKEIEVPVKMVRDNSFFKGTAEFNLTVADFDIKVPKVVINNIAKAVRVNLDMEFKSLPN